MKRIGMITLGLLAVLALALAGTPAKAAAGSTVFSLAQTGKTRILKKGETIGFEVSWSSNTQELYVIDLNIVFDAGQFGYVKPGKDEDLLADPSMRIAAREEFEIGGPDRTFRQFRISAVSPISQPSGRLISFSLESLAGASTTSVGLQIVGVYAHDRQAHKAVVSDYSLGTHTISFTENLIPTWVWIVLGISLALAIVIGYLLNLFFGTKINKAVMAAAVKTRQLAQATSQKLFKRRPMAPKLKATAARKTSSKPEDSQKK
jgi:hypothetical protein